MNFSVAFAWYFVTAEESNQCGATWKPFFLLCPYERTIIHPWLILSLLSLLLPVVNQVFSCVRDSKGSWLCLLGCLSVCVVPKKHPLS